MTHSVCSQSFGRCDQLADINCSSHLGVPEISRLPPFALRNTSSPRVSQVRSEDEDAHQFEEDVIDARILILANHSSPPTRWSLRAPLIHSPSRQPSRVGDSLAPRSQGTTRSHGRRGCMVRTNWRAEHGASSLAVRRSGGAQGAAREELEHSRLGRDGAQDGSFDSVDEEPDPGSTAVESSGLRRHQMGY